MCCHSVPGVVFISLWQICESTLPCDPPRTPSPAPLAHCSSVFHSVLECLQKASILEHSFPGLNPTSDYFILLSIGSYPYSPLVWLYKLARPLDTNSGPIPVLFTHVTFRLHFTLLLWSYFLTSSIANDERFYPYSLFFLHQKWDVPLKLKVTEHLFGTSSPGGSPWMPPLSDEGIPNTAIAGPAPACPLSSRNIPEDCTHNSSWVRWIWNRSLGWSEVLYWLLICLSHLPVPQRLPVTFFSTCSHLINF